jgi:preprotein translocase subunit SecG
MEKILIIIHLLASIGVIGLVLIQNGKGADAGSAFGGGGSGSVFGVQGSSNFLTKATALCVTLFFITSISLALVASNKHGDRSVVDESKIQQLNEEGNSSDISQSDEGGEQLSDIPD